MVKAHNPFCRTGKIRWNLWENPLETVGKSVTCAVWSCKSWCWRMYWNLDSNIEIQINTIYDVKIYNKNLFLYYDYVIMCLTHKYLCSHLTAGKIYKLSEEILIV